MPDNDLSPVETVQDETLTLDSGASALENILEGHDSDPDKSEIQKTDKDDADDAEVEVSDNSDNDLDDAEDDDSETDDSDDDAEDKDSSENEADEDDEVVLDDDTVIDMGDGKQATIAELKADHGQVQKRVADFQRDYTQKTEAHKADVQVIEQQTERVTQWAGELKQKADLLQAIQSKYIPQAPNPEMMDQDPIGYMKAKESFEQQIGEINQFQQLMQQEQTQISEQEAQEHQQFLEGEQVKLLEAMPELSDPEAAKAFQSDLHGMFAETYGFTSEEISTVADHRFAKVMRDANNWNKLKASESKVGGKVAKKPAVMKSGKSLSKNGRKAKAKNSNIERLRKTGSLESGINALMDHDL